MEKTLVECQRERFIDGYLHDFAASFVVRAYTATEEFVTRGDIGPNCVHLRGNDGVLRKVETEININPELLGDPLASSNTFGREVGYE